MEVYKNVHERRMIETNSGNMVPPRCYLWILGPYVYCHVIFPARRPHLILGTVHGLFAMEDGRGRGRKTFLDVSPDRRGVRKMATKAP